VPGRALRRRAVDPGEEPCRTPVASATSPANSRLEGAGHRRCRSFVHREALVGWRRPGRAARPAGSTRRRRTRGGGPQRLEEPPCHASTSSTTARAPRDRAAPSSARWYQRLMPAARCTARPARGTRPARRTESTRAHRRPFTPGHTTTWPCTVMPWSSRARQPPHAGGTRRLRSMPARTDGSVAWMLTLSGLSRLGDDPLEVGLGEAGERGGSSRRGTTAVVVVLLVGGSAKPRRQLVDEA